MNVHLNRKRLQVIFTEEAWANVETLTKAANRDFEVGTITYSDVVNEMALTGKVDLKALQIKRTDVKRSLRFIADQENVDLDSAIKTLMELKAKAGKRSPKHVQQIEAAQNG